MTMREIGRVKLVQIQRSSLKAGERLNRYYDPAPLLVVARLLVDPEGVAGLTEAGERIIDVHHARHPASKNQQGLNGISASFTSHYQTMRERFGPHLTDGIAGENILVEADRSFTLANLGAALAIQDQDEGSLIYLDALMVAAPCVEFSRFAAEQDEPLPAEVLKATLQFLDGGRRGFYARLAGTHDQAIVRAGDRVFAIDQT